MSLRHSEFFRDLVLVVAAMPRGKNRCVAMAWMTTSARHSKLRQYVPDSLRMTAEAGTNLNGRVTILVKANDLIAVVSKKTHIASNAFVVGMS